MSKYFTGYQTIENQVFYIQIKQFEISKNLCKSSMTHILPAEKQTTKISKYIKHYDKNEIRENKSSQKIHR